jgi:8-oxo-dGTP diphosphatase
MKHYTVTAAILVEAGEILCMQRGKSIYDYISYKFEFPGGKVENGETLEQGLMREINEEMGIDINITKDQFFLTIHHEYPDFSITMHSYICHVDSREFTLREHESFVWIKKHNLLQLDWAIADMPIVKKLMET